MQSNTYLYYYKNWIQQWNICEIIEDLNGQLSESLLLIILFSVLSSDGIHQAEA